MQGLKYRNCHLRNLSSQSHNFIELQVILEVNCYDIHHTLEFIMSDNKIVQWAVKSKIGWTLSGSLQVKQTATLATIATSIAEDKFASQLSKCWDIESYASHCVVNGHSKDEQSNQNTVSNNKFI